MENNEVLNQPEACDEEIFLTKKNGVWQMNHYKNGEVYIQQGKELVIALIDVQNPFALTLVDGEILGSQYNSLHVKHNPEKEFDHHNCFEGSEEKIHEILKGEGLVLALSKENMPKTENFLQYVKENNIELEDKKE